MFLFLLMLTIAVLGLTAIELGQAHRPREVPIWNDDVERRFLRHRDPGYRW
jgi:hypothetical protein